MWSKTQILGIHFVDWIVNFTLNSMAPDQTNSYNGPHSAVGNVSGNRCEWTADPGVASSITARSHTFVEIGHSPPFR